MSVALPALNEEETVGDICRAIRRELMDELGLVDDLIVLDGGSSDATAKEARAAGATVVEIRSVLPEFPWAGGKGESLWRSLAVLEGDVIAWIDADIRDFRPHFVTRLIAPLLLDPAISFVKGFYRRPLHLGGELLPKGGGRVTELLARPLLNALFPELTGFLQPLAGEYAGRKKALDQAVFYTGYSVEVGLLIDLLEIVGLDALAQVDLEERVHRNRPLEDLRLMAATIARTILRLAEEQGRIGSMPEFTSGPFLLPNESGELEFVGQTELERPPMVIVPAYLETLKAEGTTIIA